MTKVRRKLHIDTTLLYSLVLMAAGYVLLHDLIGGTLFSHSAWDSYTIQAMAWRDGSFSVGQDYSWLELAIYEGEYYVSFPPFPSVVMLPLTFLFGYETPNNFIMLLYSLATVGLCYRLLRKLKTKELTAALASLFLVCGSNMMWMSTNGGVWFQAQSLCLLLLTAAMYAFLCSRRYFPFVLIALAVGCRPFSICCFLPLIYFSVKRDMDERSLPFIKAVLHQWRYLIAPALIGAAYMWYNYARFDSVLEFGHNYLPEFTEAEKGQFHLSYILPNLYNIFLRPITLTGDCALEYPLFDGFLFYIANPIFLITFMRLIGDIVRKRMSAGRFILIVTFVIELLLLCAHKTFGGWQFGARYTCDLMPIALGYMLMRGKLELRRYEIAIMVFGMLLNVYGALAMNILHG